MKRKTMKFSELKRLEVCNKPPQYIEVLQPIVKQWVGIGWVTLEPEKHPPIHKIVRITDEEKP